MDVDEKTIASWPVSRVLYGSGRNRNVAAIPLGQRLHVASSNLPGRRAWHRSCGVIAFANWAALPSLFGLAPGVVCHAGSVAGPAVRSYRTFSPLQPPPFIPAPRVGRAGWGKRFVFCGTVPGVAPAGGYPAPYVDGARTFLSREPFGPQRERPSGRLTPKAMGVRPAGVKLEPAAASLKINYPEDVVLRRGHSTGYRRSRRL